MRCTRMIAFATLSGRGMTMSPARKSPMRCTMIAFATLSGRGMTDVLDVPRPEVAHAMHDDRIRNHHVAFFLLRAPLGH